MSKWISILPDNATAIQVCYNPRQSDDTWQRETGALIKLSRVLDCQQLLMLTNNTDDMVVIEGRNIQVVPVWKWLTGARLEH